MDADHTTTTRSSTPIGDPDPNGDIKLLLGPSRTSLRVSSKVLGLASPVIRAMIDPNFLSKRPSYEDPPEISLPDDDLTAMRWICSTLHFHDVVDDVPLSTLKQIALVCDKYDFSAALRSWSEIWLRRSIPNVARGPSTWDFIWLAIAFDDQNTFNFFTRSFVWSTSTNVQVDLSDPNSVDANGTLLIPGNLPGKLFKSFALP